jgi:DNA-directed RNA polymerase subunit alpha
MKQFQFEKIESHSNQLGEQTTQFRLSALAVGQALTIGNTLRRVLLTELEGTAITGVRLNGVNSEFATIAGVREDVLELLLNLKQIKFKGLLTKPLFTRVEIHGPKLVSANCFILPEDLSVLNSKQYIATISENVCLEFELKIESGCGYHIIDENLEQSSVDFLNIDSVFTPVKNVNYQVKDSYQLDEKLTENLDLLITTNGSITPNEALNKATAILETLFGSIGIDESTVLVEPKKEENLNILIEELQLSVRAYNCLKRVHIETIADLIQYSVKELKEIKNFGQKSANEVIAKLQDRFDIYLS